jgi:hypothetical protein
MRPTFFSHPIRILSVTVLMLAALLVLDQQQAWANEYSVTHTGDDGEGSLRWAITAANTGAGPHTITFAAGISGTITLATPLPTILRELTIEGPGAEILAVSGVGLYRVFESGANVPLTLSRLTLRDGYSYGNSGCIEPGGSLTLREVVITNCYARDYGGGLHVYNTTHAAIDIVHSEIFSNTAGFDGGGLSLYSEHDVTLTMTQSAIHDNHAGLNGGGLSVYSSEGNTTLTVTASEIYSNAASTGAGFFTHGAVTTVNLQSGVTLRGNIATGEGGGAFIDSKWGTGNAIVNVDHALIEANHAGGNGGGLRLRGHASLSTSLSSTLIQSNTAVYSGGALYIETDNTGSARLDGVNLLNNTAAIEGGAVFVMRDVVTGITDGCIVGNSGTAVVGQFASAIAATDNWWGVRNGPAGAGPGLGDSVNPIVDYSNFKTSPPPGCPDLSPHIGLRKSVAGLPIPMDIVTYTLVLTNSGLGSDPAVRLRDELPRQVSFLDWLQRPTGAEVTNDVVNWGGAVTPSDGVTISLRAMYVGLPSEIVTNTAAFTASLEVGEAAATFPLNGIPLHFAKQGSGTVNISPPNVNCNVNCTALALSYAPGVPVTLTAQVAPGATFAGWGDACTAFGANPVCTLLMDSAKNVSARFVTPSVRLQVHRVGLGRVYGGAPAIDCGDTCEQQYALGTSVTLYAAPQSGEVFAEWSGACTTAAPAPCVVTMTGNQVVTATFTVPGAITGTITLAGADTTEVIVTAERLTASGWQWVANSRHTIQNAAGGSPYSILNLPPGRYRIAFRDLRLQHQSQYFSAIAWGAPESATVVTVSAGSITGGVNAVLLLAVSPLATVTSSTGTVTFDPNTGEATVAQPWSEPSDITVRYEIVCPVGAALSDVFLEYGDSRFVMVAEPPGSASFVGTISGPERIYWAAINVTYMCGGMVHTDNIGSVQLYDPSGVISDAVTSQPLQDAQVVLFHVPGWRPDTSTETRECRTVDTRNGLTWENEPAADIKLGAAMNAFDDAGQMRPAVNPQRTDAGGRYGWDVAEGCYYVLVTAAGYADKVSPIVGVPPAVTDLDLKLTPLTDPLRTIFLPVISR